jgi:uncharacterized protein (DUF1786 family)
MRILAIDVGSGTQDILLFDSDRPVENSVKLILPSPTQVAARRIRRAGQAGRDLLLTGSTAGGGACSWALEDFIKAGGRAFATPDAARTFNDDLEQVRATGVEIVSEDEAGKIDAEEVVLSDLDLDALRVALDAFEEPLELDGLTIGCLDHGDAPPDVSDRIFRFDHLRRTLDRGGNLLSFAFLPGDLPDYLTRARAMVASAGEVAPIAFVDTGPAAALGALEDEHVGTDQELVVLNLGNMHLLGFHLRGHQVASVFEHHTGELSTENIVRFAERLAEGSLTHDEVFNSKGHGVYHANRSLVSPALPRMIAVTGPQRGRLRGAGLGHYFAAPFGDMMLSGCFGLLRGFAHVHPWAREAVESQLGPLR